MVRFILGLYIVAANGLYIPDAIWTISWVLFATSAIVSILKCIVDCCSKS